MRISREDALPQVYARLRATAKRLLCHESGYQTLQPSALVHEAYLRLARLDRIEWRGVTHLYAMGVTEMRRILIEQARARATVKRGGGIRRVTLHDGLAGGPDSSIELLALDEALDRLVRRNPRQARVAELRLFAGMQFEEIAAALGASLTTIKLDWKLARARLASAMRDRRRRAP